jgi:tripartite ATP-independent transporter DctM subunit
MTELLPILMFVLLFILLFMGIPIAFCLSFIGISFAFVLWGFNSTSLLANAAWGVMNNFPLIAIPLFIFMAMTLEKSKVIEDLYDTVYKWSGGLRGGLAVATIIVGTIIGAVSGVVAAGVIGLGLIALPQMLKYGYEKKISLGAVMAGGTLGQIIPPSLNMVIYGAITGVSVGSLFAGGLGAGLLMVGVFCVYILLRAFINKDLCPSLAKEDRATWAEKLKALKSIIVPALLILSVLGAIFSGAATPTEAAAVGALGVLLYSILSRRINWIVTKKILIETLKVSTMVGWVIIGAACFSSVFAGVGGNQLVADIAQATPGGKWGVLVLSILFIIFLGMFLETAAIIMLAAPIVSPIMVQHGFDPLWWGIVFMLLLQVAFLTPPFGFAIFYLKSVVPKSISIKDLYSSTFPFIYLQLLSVLLVILFPALAIWLPNLFE